LHPLDYVLPAAATLAQLLPPIAVLPAWRRTTPARRWIAILCLVFFASDIAQLLVGRALGNNLWLYIFVEPWEDAILLWALSYWQVRPITRIALRVAIPLMIGIYVAIAVAAGEQDTYKTFSGPFRAVLLMSWTAFTLISNISNSPERIWSKDWLWTTLGILLYFGLLAATEPIAAAIGTDDLVNLRRVFHVRNVIDIFAYVLIWRGMRCPLPSSSSGST